MAGLAMFLSGFSDDKRVLPARRDIAADWLKGKVEASKFVKPIRKTNLNAVQSLYRTPDDNGSIDTQILYGERFDVLDEKDGWAWGQSVCDGYVGYIKSNNLSKNITAPTHRVTNITTFVYPEPNIKTTPITQLSFGSLLSVTGEKDRFHALHNGGFVLKDHVGDVQNKCADPVAEAFRFLGVPYLWGGRNGTGIDCSALVQLVLNMCGIPAPRDSDMQEIALGQAVRRHDAAPGSLVFFPGHVGIMIDHDTIIHANDRAMAVSIDDLNEYEEWRLKQDKEGITAIKRLKYGAS